jgi:hypothetical protein
MTVTIKVTKRKRKDDVTLWQITVLLATVLWLAASKIYSWLKRVTFRLLTRTYDRLAKQESKPVDKPVNELKTVKRTVVNPIVAEIIQEAEEKKVTPKYPIRTEDYDFNAPSDKQIIRNNSIKITQAKKVLSFVGEDIEPTHEDLEAKRIYDRYYKPKSQSWQNRNTDLVDTEAYHDSKLSVRENNELIRNMGREEYRKDQYGY